MLDIIVLYIFIFFYYRLLFNWFYKQKLPVFTCYLILYFIIFYSLSNELVCSENKFMLLVLSFYLLLLLVMFFFCLRTQERKRGFTLIFLLILVFSYFFFINKLDFYSVSIAFLSCFFYTGKGLVLSQRIINNYFCFYENYFFSVELKLIANATYWAITIIYSVALWETKLKIKILKRVFISTCIWVFIYALKSVFVFFFINLILFFFLVINSFFLFAINNQYLLIILFDQLPKERYVSIYHKLYILSQLESNKKVKGKIELQSILACGYSENMKEVVIAGLQKVSRDLYERHNELLIYLLSLTDYHKLSADVKLIAIVESLLVNCTEKEICESTVVHLLKELEFSKERLLNRLKKQLEIGNEPIMDSELLLLIRTPAWYININFPFVQHLG